MGEGLIWHHAPDTPLRRPLLVAGFAGWNDAGDAASSAARHLVDSAPSSLLVTVDSDAHLDYQAHRPHIEVVGGVGNRIVWPANEYFVTEWRERDVVVLVGVEPTVGWHSFCAGALEVVERTGCEAVITLGALLGDVPHTRPVELTGSATDPALGDRVPIAPSTYEGPTGIVGALHDACRRAGCPSVSLWAPVPHYAAAPPNPASTAALLEGLGRVAGLAIDVSSLHAATADWIAEIDAALVDHDELRDYVHTLETRADDAREDGLPTGDELAEELEQFLRRQTGDGEPEPG